MKYTFRKYKMMYICLKNVKGDKIRTNEARRAIQYIFIHPSHLFKQKYVESKHNNILKCVNVITNYPYFDGFYNTEVN